MAKPIIAEIIIFFAVPIFSSLPAEVIHIKPAYIIKIIKITPKKDKSNLIPIAAIEPMVTGLVSIPAALVNDFVCFSNSTGSLIGRYVPV